MPVLTIPARDIRQGDRFSLHGFRRTASDGAWPWGDHSVSLTFEDGGYALVSDDTEFVVNRDGEAV
ncbi:hypothetical protein SAM23877_6172 [Streptomyces ambofaciens ATCC 23877]|uniref:Uncharacterized protein n=1 Tax=Streptomyces ambofaciens (strain ATCC 23877 / 3486 / DSM 40053 / JCM 4204 / NBRC 12836 / NRRL B-2516) TaxID=278992 RepID=A0A0K2B299_STRA7|nr:hypothetical protein [Streptomyces ambofaciens]AKZ59217.1 hypothetical protein SAM23877_6172 [Streptomyces ambofaciens ATCC 23877]WNA15411.1 hypothetical protein SAMYPH_80 [Streptomyces phage Samy]